MACLESQACDRAEPYWMIVVSNEITASLSQFLFQFRVFHSIFFSHRKDRKKTNIKYETMNLVFQFNEADETNVIYGKRPSTVFIQSNVIYVHI